MSTSQARKDLIEALHRLVSASVDSADRRLSEAIECADTYAFEAGYAPAPILDAAEIRARVAIIESLNPLEMRLFISHLAGWSPDVFDEVAHEILPETGGIGNGGEDHG